MAGALREAVRSGAVHVKLSVFVNLVAMPTGAEQHRAYAELLDLAELAEALSYETFWLTEHHSASGGATPDPFGLLSAAAVRTSTLRLGTAARLVGLTEPVLLTEGAAQLDALAGGRLELGLARGFDRREFEAVGRELPGSTAFLHTAVAVRDMLHRHATSPRPVQRQARVWLAASSPETARLAAGGHFPILTNHYFSGSRDRFAAMVQSYRTACGPEAHVLAHLLVHVSPVTEGHARGLAVVDRYLNVHAAGKGMTAAALVDVGLVVIGSQAAVAEALAWLAGIGVDEVAVNPLVGLHAVADVRRSLALVADTAVSASYR